MTKSFLDRLLDKSAEKIAKSVVDGNTRGRVVKRETRRVLPVRRKSRSPIRSPTRTSTHTPIHYTPSLERMEVDDINTRETLRVHEINELPRSRTSKQCPYCRRRGHTADQCWYGPGFGRCHLCGMRNCRCGRR